MKAEGTFVNECARLDMQDPDLNVSAQDKVQSIL